MNPPLYDEVQDIILKIVNASECNNTVLEWEAYQELLVLCEENENNDFNHPFQWETLADFTHSNTEGIKIYEKALKYAAEKDLKEYLATILFSLAESHSKENNYIRAIELASLAKDAVEAIEDLGLREEINEFILLQSKSHNKSVK